MGGLMQQINLYRGREPADGPKAGVRLLVYGATGALLAVLLLGIAGEIYLSVLTAERGGVAAQLARQETELASIRESLSGARADPYLESELARLRAAQTRVSADLAAVVQHKAAAGAGFAGYFGGLARSTLDGLWLNGVGVSAGGAEMMLRGQATEPELVPRLLQALAAEKAFAGRTFRKVSLQRQGHDSGAIVDFELRSARIEEMGDAG